MAETDAIVVGGVDCHSEFHHAVALDERGRKQGELRFAASRSGYQQAVGWLTALGSVEAVGIESSGSYGANESAPLR